MNNKQGKVGEKIVVLSLVALVVLAGAAFWMVFLSGGKLSQENAGGVSAGTIKEIAQSAASTCPTSGTTSFTLDVANYLNDTAAETFDVTAKVRDLDTGQVYSLTDTTSPTATIINCGDRYRVEIVAADGADGDNSKVEKIILGGDSATLNADGTVDFVPGKSSYGLRLGVTQHGVLEFRAFDKTNNGFMYDSGDASATDYETDGVSFESTTDNTTALAIGSGGSMDLQLTARATLSDNDFNDYYTYILVEAPLATWNEPSVKIDGQKLVNIKGSMTPEETNQFSSYEYVYKFDKSIQDQGDGVVVDFYMAAKSGVDPSTDPEIDFATAGRYLSIDGVTTKVGAAKDDSTNAVTFAVQDVTIDIS